MAFFGCPETDRKQDLIKCRYPNYTWIEKKMKEPKSTIFLGANKKKTVYWKPSNIRQQEKSDIEVLLGIFK